MAFNIGKGTKVKIRDDINHPRAGQAGTVKAVHHNRYVIEFKDGRQEDFIISELDYDF